MLHSILITGGTKNQRLVILQEMLNTNLKPHPDLLVINPDPSITIKQARSIDFFLSRKPMESDYQLVVLSEADKLTLQAQNAILKTLEEPPPNSKIVLLSPSKHHLISTIISRCQLVNINSSQNLSSSTKKEQQIIFNQIIKSTTGQRISLALNYGKSKDLSLEFLNLQLLYIKDNLSLYPSLARNITKAINQLKANVNPKLVLEALFFSYPGS